MRAMRLNGKSELDYLVVGGGMSALGRRDANRGRGWGGYNQTRSCEHSIYGYEEWKPKENVSRSANLFANWYDI